jgi:translation initiation factor IF-3
MSGPPPRGAPISVEHRINDRIRVPEVRLVGPAGEQVGIVAIGDALRLAQDADLDLVEVAPNERPPVCKLMDYGKFKYETAQKAREARRNQAHTVIKEMKLRPKIDPHDYETKKGHVVRFLKAGDKVKITIMFRGREQSRPEQGYRLLQRLAEDVTELGFIEASPRQDGRNMTMVMAPHRTVKEQAKTTRPQRPAREQAADGAEQVESVAVESAPVESVAAESAPVESAPVESTPSPARSTADGAREAATAPAAPARPAPPRPAAPRPAAARPAPAEPAEPAKAPAGPPTPLSTRPAPRPVPTAPSRQRP